MQAVLEAQDNGAVRAEEGTGSRCTDQPGAPAAEAVAHANLSRNASAASAPAPRRAARLSRWDVPSAAIGNVEGTLWPGKTRVNGVLDNAAHDEARVRIPRLLRT